MHDKNWMIYGATGYTGVLLAEEAVRRGHKPVLAGRSEAKLRALAERLGLTYSTFPVDDAFRIRHHIEQANVELVLHAAGPFVYTSAPMVEACLAANVHYLDITGEIPVFEAVFAQDRLAKENGIVLMSGVGFDIVPSDCLAAYVASKIPDAVELEIAIDALNVISENKESGVSAGTFKSSLEMIPGGGRVRRGGKLQPYDFGSDQRTFIFPHGQRKTLAIPWGDISTAYFTTGIPDITVYMSYPPKQIAILGYTGHLLRYILQVDAIRERIARAADEHIPGPSQTARETNRSHIYARASNLNGEFAEAWLETLEGYQFTMKAGIRCVERVLDGDYSGALTPAKAFGADFVLEIGETIRRDRI